LIGGTRESGALDRSGFVSRSGVFFGLGHGREWILTVGQVP
jgi:hypothetical protein